MKILNDKDYNVLKSRANLADGILGAIHKVNAEFDAENATVETVLGEFVDNSSGDSSELEQANTTITELERQIQEHEATIAERDETIAQLNQRLDDEPAGDSTTRAPKPKPESEESLDEVVAFLDKSKDVKANIEKVRSVLL